MAGVEISSIKSADLREIAKSADKNNDGKLKRKEYAIFAQEASAKGIDAKDINEALDMNGLQRWWYDVDKISTDGKDDGKLSFKEGITSFAKGLIGGIPKAMVNHPIATAATLGVCAGLTVLTGGAILPVLTAVGLATGVGMAGIGTYKAITAKTDSEAKQALETVGMGVTTTVMSAASAGKALAKAEQAGVKSAHVEKGANIFQKIGQTFKAIPESLSKSAEWTRFNLHIPVMKIRNDKGFVVEKRYGEDSYRQYKGKYIYYEDRQSDYGLSVKKLPNGTIKTYDHTYQTPKLLKEESPNGAYKIYDKWEGKLVEEKTADGTIREYSRYYSEDFRLLKETYANGGYKRFGKKGKVIEKLVVTDKQKSYYVNGKLLKETYANGGYKRFDKKGNVIEELVVTDKQKSYYENGELVRAKKIIGKGIIEEYYENGELVRAKKIIGKGIIEEYRIEKGKMILEEKLLPDGTKYRYTEEGVLKYAYDPGHEKYTYYNADGSVDYVTYETHYTSSSSSSNSSSGLSFAEMDNIRKEYYEKGFVDLDCSEIDAIDYCRMMGYDTHITR